MQIERSREWREGFQKEIDPWKLVNNLRACMACGKCVGSCPVAALTPSYNSRQIIRDVLLGNKDRIVESEEIWRCLWCASCYVACPANIHFPTLMMLLRFCALEEGYGIKHVRVFKRFALKAREDGITFVPGKSKLERLAALREKIGLTPLPEVSERAKEEYKALFDLTGTTSWLLSLDEKTEKEVQLTYREGKLLLD